MTPRQVRSLLTVVEIGSVNRAAEALHLAPSSVSAQLRELSTELGVSLFEQAGRKIVLSAAGKDLLPSFKAFDALVGDIKQQAQSTANEPVGELRLFSPSSMCIYRLPPLIEALQVIAPKLEITLTHEPFDYQSALHSREIDAAILMYKECEAQWASYTLSTEDVVYVCHPSRYQQRTLTLSELSQHPLISTEPGCSYRIAAEDHFRTQTLTFKPRQSFSNVEVIKRCLLANMGVGLLPRCVVEEELKREVLLEQSVVGAPYRFQSALVYPIGTLPGPKLKALISVVSAKCGDGEVN